jgi:hypothetical protein
MRMSGGLSSFVEAHDEYTAILRLSVAADYNYQLMVSLGRRISLGLSSEQHDHKALRSGRVTNYAKGE